MVVNGYKMVKEALVNQAEAFSERPLTPVFHRLNKGQGTEEKDIYSNHAFLS